MHIPLTALALTLSSLLWCVSVTHAATRVVTALHDISLGGCMPLPDGCTLREALAAAQSGDTVTFAPALFASGARLLTLTGGALHLQDKTLIVRGPGASRLRVSGNRASQGFVILNGVVTITDLTIQEGQGLDGGGIWNGGLLRLERVVLRGNRATGGGGSSGVGGAVYNAGALTISQSTITANSAPLGAGLGNFGLLILEKSTVAANLGSAGGGVWNGGVVDIRTSTLSGNRVNATGGGLVNFHGSIATVIASTLTRNTAASGGGLWNGGVLVLGSSLVAGNTSPVPTDQDCVPVAGTSTMQSQGGNVLGEGTACPLADDLTVPGAQVSTHVLLPLRQNGGATLTHMLRTGSIALEAGAPAHCAGTDQRGIVRPQGIACDSGAVERAVP
jgi:hypothetical protein